MDLNTHSVTYRGMAVRLARDERQLEFGSRTFDKGNVKEVHASEDAMVGVWARDQRESGCQLADNVILCQGSASR